MNVSIVGAGHVGLVTGACLARAVHHVLCVDRDAARIDGLNAGRLPFFEPGLDVLVEEERRSGRLRFGVRLADAAAFAPVTFICVPTPSTPQGGADLSFVDAVALELAPLLRGYHLVVETARSRS